MLRGLQLSLYVTAAIFMIAGVIAVIAVNTSWLIFVSVATALYVLAEILERVLS